jgi:hypothetical protein
LKCQLGKSTFSTSYSGERGSLSEKRGGSSSSFISVLYVSVVGLNVLRHQSSWKSKKCQLSVSTVMWRLEIAAVNMTVWATVEMAAAGSSKMLVHFYCTTWNPPCRIVILIKCLSSVNILVQLNDCCINSAPDWMNR